MSRRRVPSTQDFLFADGLNQRPVQLQCRHCGAARGAESGEASPVPAKVKAPSILARIEKRSSLATLRIAGFLPCSFAQGTRDAGERKVCQGGSSPSLLGPNVIYVEGRFLTSLREAAVFTPVTRPVNHLCPQGCRNGHRFNRSFPVAAPAASEAKGFRRGQPTLQPRVVRRPPTGLRGPACPGGIEAAQPLLWADETVPNHRATTLPIERALTCSMTFPRSKLVRLGRLVQTPIQ